MRYSGLRFECIVPENIKKLKSELKRSSLILLPLKAEASEFGSEVLVAVAAGVPVLISRYSGFASLLQAMAADTDAVVSKSDVESWKNSIVDSILQKKNTRGYTRWLQQHLPQETSITSTHLDFMNIISSTEFWLHCRRANRSKSHNNKHQSANDAKKLKKNVKCLFSCS